MISPHGQYSFKVVQEDQREQELVVVRVRAGDPIPPALLQSFKAARLLVAQLRRAC
jgi:hypothetical protein